jgi:hypothetical protein
MFPKKEFVYSCGHFKMVPDDGNWNDSTNSPCDKCLQEYILGTENNVPKLTNEEVRYYIDLSDKVSDYGFDSQFH